MSSGAWFVVGMTVVVVGWSLLVLHRWGRPVRRYIGGKAERGLARAVLLMIGSYVVALGLTWCAAFLVLDPSSGGPGDLLLAGVVLLAVAPWFLMGAPTRSGLPFYGELRADGVPRRIATTLAWVAAPFGFLGLLGVVVTAVAAYHTVLA